MNNKELNMILNTLRHAKDMMVIANGGYFDYKNEDEKVFYELYYHINDVCIEITDTIEEE